MGTILYTYPAGYDNVIGVGSVDDDKSVSSFSQRNTSVFVVAPANNVKSLSINGDYKTDFGTSFAAPLITGVVAISKCIDGQLDLNSIKLLFSETAKDLGVNGYDTFFGYGLIDVEALIEAMLSDTDWFVSPFDFEGDLCAVTIFNNGSHEENATSILGRYDSNALHSMEATNITLPQRGSITIDWINNELQVKHFLWSSLETLVPLYKTMEIQKQ